MKAKFPYVAYEQDDVEVWVCGPSRVRLLWKGRQVRVFKFAWAAVKYADAEIFDL